MSVYASFALLPGDGIGPEVMAAGRRVLEALAAQEGYRFSFDEIPCGGRYYLEHGRDWPEDAAARCDAADAILLGAVGWPAPDGRGPVMMSNGQMAGHSAVLGNRTRLDLFANVRPVRMFPGLKHRICGQFAEVWPSEKVDLVFIRENTEGLYFGAGGILRPGGIAQVATDTRIITRRASERVSNLAFRLAEGRSGAPRDSKKRVTAVVKNNVLDGCRLFAEVFQEVGVDHPSIEREIALVDAFAQGLVQEPDRYDVVVTTNMFGDILTDLAAVLQGGLGMAVGCNLGEERAMFEPIHGSAPDLVGKDRANPLAMILAAGEALRWLGHRRDQPALLRGANAIESAVAGLIEAGQPLTADLVGPEQAAPSSEVTAALIEHLGRTKA